MVGTVVVVTEVVGTVVVVTEVVGTVVVTEVVGTVVVIELVGAEVVIGVDVLVSINISDDELTWPTFAGYNFSI
jgi:hypothetical protein